MQKYTSPFNAHQDEISVRPVSISSLHQTTQMSDTNIDTLPQSNSPHHLSNSPRQFNELSSSMASNYTPPRPPMMRLSPIAQSVNKSPSAPSMQNMQFPPASPTAPPSNVQLPFPSPMVSASNVHQSTPPNVLPPNLPASTPIFSANPTEIHSKPQQPSFPFPSTLPQGSHIAPGTHPGAGTYTTSIFVPPTTSRYLLAPRLVADISTKSVVPKESRPTNPVDLRKLREAATSPLMHKLSIVPMNDSDEQIILNYNVQMRIKDLQRRLETYDMVDVFNILLFNDAVYQQPLLASTTPVTPLSNTINLLDKWDSIDMTVIIYHVHFLRLYGREWDLQNLDWTLELLEASCELTLADKVKEDLIALGPVLESGPIYFLLAMKQIVSSTEDAVLAMLTKVKNMNLAHFDGENVSIATGQLKMAIARLRVLGKVPTEINRHVLDALQTSSVSKFNMFFSQLQVNLKQIPNFTLTPDKILSMADHQYKELKLIGDWNSANNKASTFLSHQVNTTTPQLHLPVCRRCGKAHPGQKCRLPHWRDTPPPDGTPDEKNVNERKFYWCAKCSRWNTSHTTKDHTGKRNVDPSVQPELPQTPQVAASGMNPSTNLVVTDSSSLTIPSGDTKAASANLMTYDSSALRNHRATAFKMQFQQLKN